MINSQVSAGAKTLATVTVKESDARTKHYSQFVAEQEVEARTNLERDHTKVALLFPLYSVFFISKMKAIVTCSVNHIISQIYVKYYPRFFFRV